MRHEAIPEEEQLFHFAKCLRGQAATWWELQECRDINEAKSEFKDQFWGEEAQAKLREVLYIGRYQYGCGFRMSEYAMNLAKQAKYLEPPMSDHEIIRCVKRYFDKDISREIRSSAVKTLKEFSMLLDDVEDDFELQKAFRGRFTEMNVRNRRKINEDERERQTRKDLDVEPQKDNRYHKAVVPFIRQEGNVKTKQPIVETPNSDDDEKARKTTKSTMVQRRFQPWKRPTGIRETRVESKSQGKVAVIQICAEEMTPDKETENDQLEMKVENRRGENLSVTILRTKDLIDDIDELMSEENKKIEVGDPVVQIKIGELKIESLIDTGAQISAITKLIYENLLSNGIEIKVIPVKKFALKGKFNDKSQMVTYKVQFEFEIYDNNIIHEFYIVD